MLRTVLRNAVETVLYCVAVIWPIIRNVSGYKLNVFSKAFEIQHG